MVLNKNNLKEGGLPLNETKKQVNSKVIAIVVILLVLVLGGMAYYFLMPKGNSAPQLDSNPGNVAENIEQNTVTERVIAGIDVSGLFIPSGIDMSALEFLMSLKGEGSLPVVVDQGSLGKTNPFIK